MKTIHKIGISGIILVIIITGIFWFKPNPPLEKGTIIATAVPASINLRGDDLGIDNRYIPGSQIIALNVNRKDKEPTQLSEDFYSARSPEISYDGKWMVFSGQRSEGDTWQIYTMDLGSLKTFQVTQCPVNCTDPTWLPDGRIAFSRLNDEEVIGQMHVLHACQQDGSEMKRLMYHPNTTTSASVFQDGRILVISEQKYPENGQKHMLALRVDGTKSELFYSSIQNTIPISRPWEAHDGQVYFIEKEMDGPNQTRLVSVAKGHPLSSCTNISKDLEGDFFSLYPDTKGNLLVSYRKDEDQPFELYSFNISNENISQRLYSDNAFHVIEAIILQERTIPMKLPAIVDESKEKGTLLCLDTDLSLDLIGAVNKDSIKTEKVQVFGLDRMLGEVAVENDGSFYIEIDADTPVRFKTIDANGDVLRGPSSWVWVRPNERRSCIGCHEDRELAPDNKVPEALYNGMLSLPDGSRTEAIVLSGTGNKKDNEE